MKPSMFSYLCLKLFLQDDPVMRTKAGDAAVRGKRRPFLELEHLVMACGIAISGARPSETDSL